MALLGGANAYLDPLAERAPDARGAHPLWTRWNDERGTRYSLGVEEELMLLNPGQWSLAQSSDQVIARLSDELWRHTSPETQAAVVELTTGVHADVDGVVAELAGLRTRPHALALGCAGALERAAWLGAATGADRQRALAAAAPAGLEHVVAGLAGRFLAPDRLAATRRCT